MSQVKFLLDEDLPGSIGDAIGRREPSIFFRQVGADPDVPPKSTLDPDVLIFAESEQYAVVTFDKRTMKDHGIEHLAKERTLWGLFVFPNGNRLSAGRVADELLMIWTASEAEEWIDRIENLPF